MSSLTRCGYRGLRVWRQGRTAGGWPLRHPRANDHSVVATHLVWAGVAVRIRRRHSGARSRRHTLHGTVREEGRRLENALTLYNNRIHSLRYLPCANTCTAASCGSDTGSGAPSRKRVAAREHAMHTRVAAGTEGVAEFVFGLR